MIKRILTLLFLFISVSVFSQRFVLPHAYTQEDFNKYIGQKVKIATEFGADKRDIQLFESISDYAICDSVYTIEKIKVKSKIICIYLKDSNNHTFQVKVNKYASSASNNFNNCGVFLLVDEYNDFVNKEIAKSKGREFLDFNKNVVAYVSNVIFEHEKNLNGENVIKPKYEITTSDNKLKFVESYLNIVDYKFKLIGSSILNEKSDTSITFIELKDIHKKIYIVKNHFTQKTFEAELGDIQKHAQIIGTNIWHPLFKHTYQVKDFNENNYICENLTTKETFVIKQHNYKDNLVGLLTKGKYVTILNKVIKPSNSSIRYGKTSIITDDVNKTKYGYIDNLIDILIVGNSESFSFILKNKSENSIKIVWNEAVFVDFDGTTSKIMHLGTKYSQREADQPASVIIGGAKIEDVAVPTKNVRLSNYSNEWITESMYPYKPGTNPGQIRLMLPIQIKDVINEYVFVFDVKFIYENPELVNTEE